MTWKTITLALCAAFTLTACDKSGAQKSVLASLKDPDSAKFGDFYFNQTTKKGCLTVNSKNSMGGYTGEQQAYVEKKDTGWETIGIAEITLESCRKIHADIA